MHIDLYFRSKAKIHNLSLEAIDPQMPRGQVMT